MGEGYLVVGILVFAAMVFTVVIVAFFPQWMTQAVDESGKYDNLDKKVDVLQVDEEEEEKEDEKKEIELAEEVNPDKANENQKTDAVEKEKETEKTDDDADKEKSDFVD